MDYDALQRIRGYEFERLIQYLSPAPGKTVLEIGAGAGWQAKALADRGIDVVAIDIAESLYETVRVFPVVHYDGEHIPLEDASVDVVFSSNVLEHVPHVHAFQDEIARVLRSGGYAVHVMPTSTWRFWTSLAHYIYIVKWMLGHTEARTSDTTREVREVGETPKKADAHRLKRLIRLMFPYRHGETGSHLTELWLFNHHRWSRLFRQAGWSVERIEANQLYYSGYSVLGHTLSVGARHALSAVLGSSSMTYVVRPEAERKPANPSVQR